MRLSSLLNASVTLVTGLVHVSLPRTVRRGTVVVGEVERTFEGVRSDFRHAVNGASRTNTRTNPSDMSVKLSSTSDTLVSRRKTCQLRVPPSDLVFVGQILSANASISELTDQHRRGKKRWLAARRTTAIWRTALSFGWRVTAQRRRFANDAVAAVEARRALAAEFRDALLRLGCALPTQKNL